MIGFARRYLPLIATAAKNLLSPSVPKLLLGSLLFTGFSSASYAQITFFQDCNFLGKAITLPAGNYNSAELAARGIPNDSISAAVVPEGFSATLYQGDHYSGQSGLLKSTLACFDIGPFDNAVSSLTIQSAGQEAAVAASLQKQSIRPKELVTIYADCGYKGGAMSLEPGEYTLADLEALGIINNDISAISVPRGFSITAYENDFFRGSSVSLIASDKCLQDNGLDNAISSLIIQKGRPKAQSTQTNATTLNQTNILPNDTVSAYSECNYKGLGLALAPGKYLVQDLEKLGMPNNAISSLRVPDGFNVTLYENDFFRGNGKALTRDDNCLIGDKLNDKVSSIVVLRTKPAATASSSTTLNNSMTNNNSGTISNNASQGAAATVYAKCGFGGTRVGLAVGEYMSSDLANLGLSDNSISSVQVTPGYQIEMFFYDFLRGKSGYLTHDDDCLINDAFDNEISSLKITKVAEDNKPLTQIDGSQPAATMYQHCDFKGGNISLKAGRYSQESLRKLGVGNDVISSLKVQPGFQVVLYDNGQMRGQGVAITGDDNCLDDNGLYRKVSSLIIAPVRAPGKTREQIRAEKEAQAFVLDASLDCVELYVERDICNARSWPDITARCKLAEVPAMNDGYLQGHVEIGNCTARNWPALVERIKNPAMR